MIRRLLLLLILAMTAATCRAAGKAEHVIVIVWDGLRPDSINLQDTPTLYNLVKEGVFFKHHHPVYLSSTEVNGVAMATGAYPARNGIMGNNEYRPAIDPLKATETQSHEAVRKGDELTGGHYLGLPTIVEILQRAGDRTAVAGTKPVALLWDRIEQGRACTNCINYFAGNTIPPDATAHAKEEVYTPGGTPNARQDRATTLGLIGPQWDAGVPPFSMLWLSEPDLSQHLAGLGSPTARAALKSSDDNLARVLAELNSRGERAKTDIFVVSDHGFSTVSRPVDVADVLRKAGFNAARRFKEPPKTGDIVVVGDGGSVLLYVIGRDEDLIRHMVLFLQKQDFTGVLFARNPAHGSFNGTFTLDKARIDSPDTPDIVLSFRWSDGKNAAGIPGMVYNDGSSRIAGQGTHASLSAFDMHNTLVAAGPDFQYGATDELPTGNTDLAPTILAILGVPQPVPMDGRVLSEAFAGAPLVTGTAAVETITSDMKNAENPWHQYLKVSKYGGAVYFDEGNGSYKLSQPQ